jgi:hypothetical protein
MAKEQYWARRPFGYAGIDLDRGQLFALVGARNDEKLVRLGYCEKLERTLKDINECGTCGSKFIDVGTRDGHVLTRHSQREDIEAVPAGIGEGLEDKTGDRREAYLQEVAPLYLDKTTASRT